MIVKKVSYLLIITLCLIVIISCQTTEDSIQNKTETSNEQVANLTTETRLVNIKGELKTVKAELAQAGEYNCCIQPACDWCLLHEGKCSCYENLKTGKEVCPGCGLGWHNGIGVVEGTKASQVKWNITHEHAESGHKH